MKALIVDDHPIARSGLRTVLERAFVLERVVEVDRGAKAVAAAEILRPGLVLVDLDIPDHPHGAELCAQLRAAVPAARIALVTAFARTEEIRRCFDAGIDGCLLKDTTSVDLGAALRAMVAGETVIDPRIAPAGGDGADGRPGVRLTRRERDVLAALAQGWSNRVIGERLGITEGTVKDHVGAVMAKLGATSRLHALVRASDEGLL